MKHQHPEHTHAHSHSHAKDCACDHDHEHNHDHNPLSLSRRWVLSVLIVGVLLIIIRSFIVDQMIVRVTSYSVNASYSDAIRICKKIIFIDPHNIRAWTSLGYVYMDMSRVTKAIPVFEKVISLNPEDHGAASFELGKAYYAQGDFKNAILNFERVRSAGPQAGASLEADILKYRHGTLGFRSLNSMQELLKDLADCYKKTGNTEKAAEVQIEYESYKNKHSKILF